jgi:hypothetical protein
VLELARYRICLVRLGALTFLLVRMMPRPHGRLTHGAMVIGEGAPTRLAIKSGRRRSTGANTDGTRQGLNRSRSSSTDFPRLDLRSGILKSMLVPISVIR